jgi:hypothetical protein
MWKFMTVTAQYWSDWWCMWHVWERRGPYGVLVGKPEGNRPLVIPRHIYGRIILKWIIQK